MPTMPPDDPANVFSGVYAFAKDWLGPGVGIIVLGFIWRAAGGWSKVRAVQDQHAAKLDEHHDAIRRLESDSVTTRERLSRLPTREDLDRVVAQLQSQMQDGFKQIMQLFGRADPRD